MEAATESGEDRDSLLFVSPGLLSYERPSDPAMGWPWNGLSLVLKICRFDLQHCSCSEFMNRILCSTMTWKKVNFDGQFRILLSMYSLTLCLHFLIFC